MRQAYGAFKPADVYPQDIGYQHCLKRLLYVTSQNVRRRPDGTCYTCGRLRVAGGADKRHSV